MDVFCPDGDVSMHPTCIIETHGSQADPVRTIVSNMDQKSRKQRLQSGYDSLQTWNEKSLNTCLLHQVRDCSPQLSQLHLKKASVRRRR